MNELDIKRKFPNASPGFIKANISHSELYTPKQEPVKRSPLERVPRGKDKSRSRFEIRFTVYSQLPLDWDNNFLKYLQDLLVKSGILHDDKWDVLRGSIESKKVYRKEEERTEIEIIEL